MLIGGAGADSLTGGNGTDTASYANAAAGVLANLGSAGSNTGDAEGDTYTTIENLTGSDFADTLTGNSSANTIGGGMGSDTLSGGSGVDTLNGGDGDDTLIGGTSGDALDGGSGSDTASYSTSAVAVNVNLATGAVSGGDAVSDTFSSIENLTGTSGNDTLTGNTGANVLSGLAGTDTLSGGDGDDTLIGGSGGDTLTGGNGADTASYATAGAAVTVSLAGGTHTGDAASDTFSGIENLKGSAHNDTLTGDANANVVEGGLGNDTLAGGSGSDTYAFNRGDGADTVNNGDNTSSTDRLTFATDVAHDQLWFQQSGNDLVVTVIGTTDTVTLKNWYATTPDKLDEIRSSNGKFLTAANVQALVDAMSAYSPPAQGQTTLPAELQAALGSTIDANWQNILPPVIIDLNRDGFQFTPFEQSVRFDADNDGTKELVNWVGGGDGIAGAVPGLNDRFERVAARDLVVPLKPGPLHHRPFNGNGRLLKLCREHEGIGLLLAEQERQRLASRAENFADLTLVNQPVADRDLLVHLRDRRQGEVAPLLVPMEDMADEVVDMQALHHDGDRAFLLVVEPVFDRAVEPLVRLLSIGLGQGVLGGQRVVNHDQVGAYAGHARVDRGGHPVTALRGRDESGFVALGTDLERGERGPVPIGLDDLPKHPRIPLGQIHGVRRAEDSCRWLPSQRPGRQRDREDHGLHVAGWKGNAEPRSHSRY